MPTRKFQPRDFSGQLNVVASISDALFAASLDELRARDKMIVALRESLRLGVPVSELSAETGLTVEQVRKLAARNLTFGEDLNTLTGISF